MRAAMITAIMCAAFVAGSTAASKQNDYTLAKGDVSVDDSRNIVIKMITEDVNAIKQMIHLATKTNNTYLSMNDLAALDMNGNVADKVLAESALSPSSFKADASAPVLLAFELDLDKAVLLLNFSEPIKRDLVDPKKFRLQKAATAAVSSPGAALVLTGGTVSPVDSTVISITLTDKDCNKLKQSAALGVSRGTTWLAFGKAAASDMSANPIDELPNGKAMKASFFVQDATKPKAKSFALNMNTATMAIEFDETIDASSFDPTSVRIQNSSVSGPKYCACKACPGKWYIASACTLTHQTGCQTCASCPTGRTTKTACAKSADTTCKPCAPCASGSFVETLCSGDAQSKCTACSTSCTDCAGPGDSCLACKSGTLLHLGKCQATCPHGMYASNGKCLPCDPSCARCNGPAATQCLACDATLLFDNGACSFPCVALGKYQSDDADKSLVANFTLKLENVINEPLGNGGSYELFTTIVAREVAAALKEAKTKASLPSDINTTVKSIQSTWSKLGILESTVEFAIRVDGRLFAVTKGAIDKLITPPTVGDEKASELLQVLVKDHTVFLGFGFSKLSVDKGTSLETGDMCEPCDKSCKTCLGPSTKQCTSCRASKKLIASTSTCVDTCPAGTYTDSSTSRCFACPSGCSRCTDNGACQACTGSLVLENKVCRVSLTKDPSPGAVIPKPTVIRADRLTNCSDLHTNVRDLVGATDVSSLDATHLTFKLTVKDQNALKMVGTIATSKADTYISVLDAAFKDMAKNTIIEIPAKSGVQVSAFTKDTSAPRMVESALDLQSRTLALTFSEPISVATFSVAGVTLQNDDCLVCTSNTSRHQGECISTCPDGYYHYQGDAEKGDAVSARSCRKCHATCGRCTGPSASNCKTCQPTLLLSNGKCSFPCFSNGAYYRNGDDDRYIEAFFTLDFDSVLHASFTTTAHWDSFRAIASAEIEKEMGRQQSSVTRYGSSLSLSVSASKIVAHSQGKAATSTKITLSVQVDQAFYEDLSSILDTVINPGTNANSGPLIHALNKPAEQGGHASFSQASTASVVSGPTVTLGNMCSNCSSSCGQCTGKNSTDCVACSSGSALSSGECVGSCPASTYLNTDIGECTPCASSAKCDSCLGGLVQYSLTNTSSAVTTAKNGLDVWVKIGDADFNNIAALTKLAASNTSSNVAVNAVSLKDMAGNPCSQQVSVVSSFKPDQTPGTLTDFQIDLSKETLTLTFSETTDARTVNATRMLISAGASASAPSRRLSGATVVSAKVHSTVVTLKFLLGDLNAMKAVTELATEVENSLLSMKAATVKDMAGNANEPLEYFKPSAVEKDGIPPTLATMVLDMNLGMILLGFSETVNATSLATSNVTVQSSPTSPSARLTLSGGTVSSAYSHMVNITLTTADMNRLKADRSLATGLNDSFVTLAKDAVKDMSGNSIKAMIHGVKATKVIEDTTRPVLSAASMNMDAGKLRLTFQETVDAGSLSAKLLTLRGAASSSSTFLNLTGGESKALSLTALEVSLTEGDLNAVKKDTKLCVSNQTCFVEVKSGSVTDMNRNTIAAVDASSAVIAAPVTPDKTNPKLKTYELDMNNQKIQFTFSETMDASTLSGLQIQLHDSSTPSSTLKLTGGVASVKDSTVLTLQLRKVDFDELQKKEGLATGKSNTFLTLSPKATSKSLTDMNKNTADAVTVPMQASGYRDDQRAAKLVGFALDMTTETMTLNFSETMNVTAIDASQLVLQSGSSTVGTVSHQLKGERTAARLDSTSIAVKLLKDDVEALKSELKLCTSAGNTHVYFSAALVSDQSGVDVSAVQKNASFKANVFTADKTRPTLVSFALNLTSNQVELSFSETLLGSSVDIGKMQVQSSANSASGTPVALGGGKYVAKNALTVTFDVSTDALNQLKKQATMATGTSNTYIKLGSGAATDMADNGIDTVVKVADSWFKDTIPPQLIRFNISMATGEETATLVFDETVDASTANVTEIAFQSLDSGGASFALKAASPSVAHDTVISIKLTKGEVDELKRLAICVKHTHCFVTSSSKAITDMSGLALDAVERAHALNATGFVGDQTAPTVEEYVKFDYNAKTLEVRFSEPVAPLTVSPVAVELHAATDLTLTSTARTYKLTGGATNSSRGHSIVIDLSAADLNAIKKNRNLCQFTSNCYIRVSSKFAQDAFGNPVTAVVASDISRKATKLVRDNEGAILQKFSFDMQNGTIALTFDEPVGTHSLIAPKITVQNGIKATESLTLAPSLKDTDLAIDGLVSSIKLSGSDILLLKAKTGLATAVNDTFVSVESGLVEDLERNTNQAIPDGNGLVPLQASSYIKDTTSPSMTEFQVYDPNTGKFEITFDEPVDLNSINYKYFTIQSAANVGKASHQLTLPGKAVYSDSSKMTVTIEMAQSDLKKFRLTTHLLLEQRQPIWQLMLVRSQTWQATKPKRCRRQMARHQSFSALLKWLNCFGLISASTLVSSR